MDRNYYLEYEKIISALGSAKPSLLLHVCCAPCASVTLERLCPHFEAAAFYCNQNIFPREEYLRRLEQLPKLIKGLGVDVPVIEGQYDPEGFESLVSGMEALPEGGARCRECFRMRLESTAARAASEGFEWFTTSLSVGPMKSVRLINEVGEELAEKYGVRFLPSEFRKRDGYKRSLELSARFGLYRQSYCGCRFSVR